LTKRKKKHKKKIKILKRAKRKGRECFFLLPNKRPPNLKKQNPSFLAPKTQPAKQSRAVRDYFS
jgi:hypothetical protein